MLRRVALVRTDDSEELSASIIKVTRIGELKVRKEANMEFRLKKQGHYLLPPLLSASSI
jgi:hypothetical protein